MKWSKENLRLLYQEKFALEFSDDELEFVWRKSKDNNITPTGDRMNIAGTPMFIRNTIQLSLERSNLSPGDNRLKKMKEELMPAIDFALFLKKIGFGEHLICLSDSPDIILVKKDGYKAKSHGGHGVMAIPLEVTFVKDSSWAEASGSTSAEKLINILSKKLTRSYSKHTTLLVVIDALIANINLEELNFLLQEKGKNFHHIYVYANVGDDLYMMARVYPDWDTLTLSATKDLEPLMY